MMADEAYRKLVYTDAPLPDLFGIYDLVITVTSHSKDLALPGREDRVRRHLPAHRRGAASCLRPHDRHPGARLCQCPRPDAARGGGVPEELGQHRRLQTAQGLPLRHDHGGGLRVRQAGRRFLHVSEVAHRGRGGVRLQDAGRGEDTRWCPGAVSAGPGISA